MNPVCKFCLRGSCRSSKKCANRYEELSLKASETMKKLNETYSSLGFGATGTTLKQVQQTTTIESNTESTTSSPNKLNKTKSTKKQLEQELKGLRNEIAKLNGNIVTLGTMTSMLTEEVKEEMHKKVQLTDEFNIELLNSDDHQCCICLQIFIRPSLLGCSHMFCEWCIDKWLEKYNHCPTCRVAIVTYTLCLNMNNFIQRKMEKMPAEIRLKFKELEITRATEKQTSIQLQAERRRLDFITMTLNQRRAS